MLDPQTHVSRLPTGAEPTVVTEVSYVPRENLDPVEDASCSLAEGLKQASEGDWVNNCAGLLLLRRVIAHEKAIGWQSM